MLPIISTALLLSSYGLVEAFPHGDTETPTYNALDWAPCDLDFPESVEELITFPVDCATLEVPLDYTNPDSETLDLQLVKVNATKEPFKGSVIFNPGGPGVSGVEEVATKGPMYCEYVIVHHILAMLDSTNNHGTVFLVDNST